VKLEEKVQSFFLTWVSIDGADRLIYNINGGSDLTLFESQIA